MHKSRGIVSLTGWLLFIGFTVQIGFGLVWMVRNFPFLQMFGETVFQVQVSSTLRVDDYTGVLYPSVLLLMRVIGASSPRIWYMLMYAIQLILALFAGFYLLRSLRFFRGRVGACLWGSLVILTFPHMMQCHLAVLPYSVIASLLMLYAGALCRSFRRLIPLPEQYTLRGKAAAGDMALAGLLWLLLSLCAYEYLYLGLLPLLVLLGVMCARMKPGKKWQLLYPGVILLLYLGLILGMGSLTQEKGLYARPEKSLTTMLFDRVAWSGMLGNPSRWPERLKEELGEEILYQVYLYPDNVKRLLEPALESSLGTERAQELYREITRESVRYYRTDLLRALKIDLAGIICPPPVTALLLRGYGYESYAIRNFDVMKRQTPVLSAYYMDYGNWWFALAALIGALQHVCALLLRRSEGAHRAGRKPSEMPEAEKERLRGHGFAAALGLLLAGLALWDLLQGCGMQDYKTVIFVTALWIAGIMMGASAYAEASSDIGTSGVSAAAGGGASDGQGTAERV